MNNLSFFKRFMLYQKQRFPLLGHAALIASFTFSAMAFSLVCMDKGISDLFSLTQFLKAFCNTFLIFLLLRISDEFKDADYDKQFRPHLPVPAGLVSLKELGVLGVLIFVFLTVFNFIYSSNQLTFYFVVLAYLFLMFKEFFVHEYLGKHQFLYVISHMMIIPLLDTLAASFAWGDFSPDQAGLFWFFAISFFNGLTLELGRKIKAPEAEEANSYSTMIGFDRSMLLFRIVLSVTLMLCLFASWYASIAFWHYLIFVIGYVVCLLFTFKFSSDRNRKNASVMEKLSGVWAILMYLNLGTSLFF